MKLYTVTQNGIENGIQVEQNRFFFISAGEEGRGRRKSRLPIVEELGTRTLKTISCPHRGNISWSEYTCPECGEMYSPHETMYSKNPLFIHPDVGTVESPSLLNLASVIRTKAKGTLLLVPEKSGDDKNVLVKLAVEAGYRGKTSVTLSDGVQVLKEGLCAQGDAGRMGNHREYLIIMEPCSYAIVERFGRLYGAPAIVRIDWDGEELKFRTFHSEEEMEEYLDMKGEYV